MKVKVRVKSLSHVQLLATPWTAAHQAPPSVGFSRQEYWSGVPLPSAKQSMTMKSVSAAKYLMARMLPIWSQMYLRIISEVKQEKIVEEKDTTNLNDCKKKRK